VREAPGIITDVNDLPPLPPMPPWEPPLAGSEVEHLLGALDRLRATFRWKAGGLDAAGLNARLPPSQLTLGGLLKHLAMVEDHSSTRRLTGEPPGEPWQSVDWQAHPEWELTSAADDTPEQLYELYDGAVARWHDRVAAVLVRGGLDQPSALDVEGHPASVRRVLFDLVEEYGRHTGHADLLRESIDGLVGEDPPWDG
jgi:hypothetical protein